VIRETDTPPAPCSFSHGAASGGLGLLEIEPLPFLRDDSPTPSDCTFNPTDGRLALEESGCCTLEAILDARPKTLGSWDHLNAAPQII